MTFSFYNRILIFFFFDAYIWLSNILSSCVFTVPFACIHLVDFLVWNRANVHGVTLILSIPKERFSLDTPTPICMFKQGESEKKKHPAKKVFGKHCAHVARSNFMNFLCANSCSLRLCLCPRANLCPNDVTDRLHANRKGETVIKLYLNRLRKTFA